jgi:diguanylate cyclase
MHYNDTLEDSRQYLRLALALMGKNDLPTDPLNYCVWYDYASGKNGDLNAAIDRYLEKAEKLDAEASRQFYSRYIASETETVAALVRDELAKIFSDTIGVIKNTNRQFSRSELNLESINEALVETPSEADVEAIVSLIMKEIKSLESTSNSFKEQLKHATHEIDQLKSKMAQYRNEALKDPLTQIHNRRGFQQKLTACIEKANTTDKPLSLIIADIDHFKKVNDTYGHLVGDNVLRAVAATIMDSIKGKDIAARIGGEEFAILLPDTSIEGAKALADNMRRVFEELDLKRRSSGESLGRITLSFGVTSHQDNEAIEDFVHRADQALYQSKADGRNRVTGL